jgi:hypothetical protein
MTQAIRQQVVVGRGGKIEFRAPQLKEGTRAEVVVFEDVAEDVPLVPLVSLVGSCKGMFSSSDEADEFLRRERDSWGL